MRLSLKTLTLGAAAAAFMASSALAGTLTINTDTSDPAPQKAFQYLIDSFQKANPDIKVKWNKFDHEGYKSAIRNFLTADAPDLANWYAGNRMAPFVKAGLFADVSDVWKDNGLDKQLKSALPSMTIDGKQWGVPYTYYQWGIYYRADIFKKEGIEPPKTWDELLAACKKLKADGITPFAIGTKPLWPAAGWFDYLDLRTNGYEFHMKLTSGEIKYTDPRVKKVFDHWAELVKPGYFVQNAAALDWQDAVPLFAQGKAAMYLMGNFAVDVMKNAGLKEDQIGFIKFPTIDPEHPRRRGRADRYGPHPGAGQEQGRRQEVPRLPRQARDADRDEQDPRPASGQQPVEGRRRQVPAGRASSCSRTPTAWRSSTTATRRRRWPRPAWRASSTSWRSRATSTRS